MRLDRQHYTDKNMLKASKAVRFFFLNTAIVSSIIIWLSRYYNIPELLYIIPGFFIFAAVTGICPGMIIAKKIFNET